MVESIISNPFYLKVWGDHACFTRPEMKVERVSYDVMTPSAARGILESILWKPAIRWIVSRIDVLNSIKWASVRRNEIGKKMSARSKDYFFIEDERQQRAGLFLRDVAYGIHAFFEMTENAGANDSVAKFTDIFIRRAKKGQCFQTPYLGCREFQAKFQLYLQDESKPQPVPETRDIGWMLLDLIYQNGFNTPKFFKAELKNGILNVPKMADSEVKS